MLPQAHVSAKVLDTMLTGRRYLACERLTIADFVAGSIFPDWKANAMPLDDYKNLRRWLDGLMETAGVRLRL